MHNAYYANKGRGIVLDILQQLQNICFRLRDVDSFCGDVAMDNVFMASRDGDSILDQMYCKQICLNFDYFNFLL